MKQVKEFREKFGYKQEEIAKFLGMSAANYCKKESGSINFSLREAKILSELFEATMDEIFFTNKVSKNDTLLNVSQIEPDL